MLRKVIITTMLLSAPTQVRAGSTEDVLRLWAQQTGMWVGEIVIYGPSNTNPQTEHLKTRWQSTPDNKMPVKFETFDRASGDLSTVTVMMSEADSLGIVTSYFYNGTQRDYRFKVLDALETDERHWTTVIASPEGKEIYEGRPAVLRYVRTRSGDTIENTKEVNFLDDGGDETFEIRSRIHQRLEEP